MAEVAPNFLARSFQIFTVFLALYLLDLNHPVVACSVVMMGTSTQTPTPAPSPISIAFEKDGSIFDDGYVIPANIVDGACRTDLVVSTASADTIVVITNNGTCYPPGVSALSCFPETLGESIVGMNMSMPQGPMFEWREESLGLYARGSSSNASFQLSNPGGGEPSVNVGGLQLGYTTPAESNISYGLLGLGKQSTLLQYLTSEGLIASNAYGLFLGTKLHSTGPLQGSTLDMSFPGSLVLGGYDKRQFGGPILGGSLSDTNFPRIEISEIVLHNGYELPQPTEPITVDVDSTTPDFHLPDALVKKLADDIGATLDAGLYRYVLWGSDFVGNVTMKIRVPASLALSSPSIDGAVQELAITIPGSEFYQLHPTHSTSNGSLGPMYYLPVRPATGRLVVGRAFLRSMYLVVDYDKGEFYLGPPAWKEQGAQDLVPIVSSWWWDTSGSVVNEPDPGGESKSKAGVIVGGVLGGIAAVLILAGVAYWWFGGRRSSKDDSATTDQKPEEQQMADWQGEAPPAWPGYSEGEGSAPVSIRDIV